MPHAFDEPGTHVKPLHTLAKLCAIVAGLLMVAVTLMTCVSLIGRNTTGWTIVGDIELTAAAAGAAVAMFLPWCQVRRSHIIVDFFTAKASAGTNATLDRVGALVTAAVLGLMAWRSAIGGINAWNSNEASMMLNLPNWIVYAFVVPGLALAALIALVQALRGMRDDDDHAAA
jgi:TRAP-type C4-dicarboxylate transport system permease small subunit